MSERRKRGSKFLFFGIGTFAGLAGEVFGGFLNFLDFFLELIQRFGILRLRGELFLHRGHLLLQAGCGIVVATSR